MLIVQEKETRQLKAKVSEAQMKNHPRRPTNQQTTQGLSTLIVQSSNVTFNMVCDQMD